MKRRLVSPKVLNVILALLLPVVLLLAAIISGNSDTKIPAQLTLRFAKFDFGIFNGVKHDIEFASDFSFSRGIREFLSFHVDPFFLIATILPQSLAPKFLYFAYFLRFGLASLTMNRLLRKQMEFGAVFSCLLGVIYSLCAPVLMISSYSSLMDVIILIPLVLSSTVEFYKDNYSMKRGIIFALLFGLTLIISGNYALLYVVPFVFCAITFLASCTSHKFSRTLVSLICILPYYVVSLLIGGIAIVNSFVASKMVVTKDILATFDFRITIFDTLLRFFAGKPLISGNLTPALYITIFVLITILAFLINSKIPLRIRVSFIVILILYHLSFASKAWYRLSILFQSTDIPSEISANMRFACIAAILIFVSAISLRNMHLLSKRQVFGCTSSIIILLILSNSSAVTEVPSTFSLYFTALAAIISFLLLSNINKLDSKTIVTVVLFGLFINLAFVLPISRYKASLDDDSIIFDNMVTESSYAYPFEELSFFEKDVEKYMVLRDFTPDANNEIEKLNRIANSAGVRPVFEPLSDCKSFFAGGRAPMINGNIAEEDKGKVEAYVNVNLSPYELSRHLMIFSDHEGDIVLEITSGEDTSDVNYLSPVIAPIKTPDTINFQAKFYSLRGSLSNPNNYFDFYTYGDSELQAFEDAALPYDGEFVVPKTNDGTVIYTVLTGRDYNDSIKVTVNGEEVTTMNIYGKLAFAANPNIDSVVKISTDNSDLIVCFYIALFVVVCSIVIVFVIYIKEKRSANN